MVLPSLTLDESAKEQLLERFLRYVQIDTRSDENSESTPSTPCQWDLLRLLEKELREMGVNEVNLDDHGYLFATLPASPAGAETPIIGYLAHVDTYPGTSGRDVKPQVIRNYGGGDISLPGDPAQTILAEKNSQLAQCLGHTLITTDGTTLLGADDKAGIAVIMTLVDWFLKHPDVPHATLRIGFNPDEEIGAGTKHFDLDRFGARAAYTFDGSLLGEIENETFNADSATVQLKGFDVHPGYAKGAMINATRAAAYLVSRLPQTHLPETTEGRQSYLHPVGITGDVHQATVRFIVRAFTMEELEAREEDLRRAAREAEMQFPGLKAEVEFKFSYRNMKSILDQHPEVMDTALEAVRAAGLEPQIHSIRGGTDGSALTLKGLPTPNIFAGAQNFHGVQEWVSLQWMVKSAEVGLHLAHLWGQKMG